jgi:hypothetical protein
MERAKILLCELSACFATFAVKSKRYSVFKKAREEVGMLLHFHVC